MHRTPAQLDAELADLDALSRTRALTWEEAARLDYLIRRQTIRENVRQRRARQRRAAILTGHAA